MEPAAANDTPGGVYRVSRRQFRPTLLLFYVHTLRYYRLHNRWCKKFGCRPPPLFFYLHVVEQLPSAGPHQNTIKFKPICFWKWPYIPLAYNVGEVSEWRKTKRKRLNLNHRDFLIGIVIDWWTIILISLFISRFSPRTCEVSNISKPFRFCL